MLCPEVWNFDAHESHFELKKGYRVEKDYSEKINSFFYNHLLLLVLPDSIKIPESLSELLTVDTEYYKVINIPACELVNKDLIENFIKKGNLTLLSINTHIDCEDCLCITPTGQLLLSLTKDTYQELGVEGKLSHFSHNTKNRYIVHINLLADTFEPGKNYYKCVKSCLTRLKRFTILVNWSPPSENICPSSIAQHFNNCGYKVQECKPDLKIQTAYSVRVPTFDISNIEEDDVHDVVEWLGMLTLKGDTETGAPDNYLTTYQVPEPNSELGEVKLLEIRGLFTVNQVENLYKELRKFVQTEDKKWGAMYVQGFSDSIVNWDLKEHNFYTNGDYSFVLITTPTQYLIYKQTCSSKYYKYK